MNLVLYGSLKGCQAWANPKTQAPPLQQTMHIFGATEF